MENLRCLGYGMGPVPVKKEELAEPGEENRVPKRAYERPVATPARNTTQPGGDDGPNPSPVKKKTRQLNRQDMPQQCTNSFSLTHVFATYVRIYIYIYI